MNIPNKQELQQIVFYYLSDIDFKDFINHYKNFTVKPYSFLFIDASLTSDNPYIILKEPFPKNVKTNHEN